MNKIKLLLVSPVPPPYGGIANWTNLMKNYINDRDDTDLTIFNIAPKKRSTDGRNLWDRIVVSGFSMLKMRNELKKIIKNNKPDVIHMTTSGQFAIIRDILFLSLAKNFNIPTVYHIRFGRVSDIAKANTCEWKLMKKAISLATVTMAIDNRTYNSIKENVDNANVVCIPNPVDISRLPKVYEEKSLDKQVVFLGWNIKAKGIEELITAWNKIGSKYKEYTLNLIGPSKEEYKKHLESIAKVGNIIFSGEQPHDKAMDILNKGKIFILPSYTEGFPNVVVEAMVLKKPIIATDVGAIADMLSDDCGIVIKPKSVNEIENALIRLIDDEDYAIRLSENAYSKALNNYTIEKIYIKYMEIWQTLKENKEF